MAKGYWIVDLEITDPATYAQYQAFVRPFLAENGGQFIVRGGQQEVVEGTAHTRQVVIEFESFAAAQDLYHSAAYQAGKQKRATASVANFVIVEGFDV